MNRYRYLFVGAAIALAMLAAPGSLHAANTIKIVSGNGQVNQPCGLCPQYVPVFQPLVVQVTNESGVPQPNIPVNWAIVSGGFNSFLLFGSATYTDAEGTASNTLLFTAAAPQGSSSLQYTQTSISANISEASVTFTETLGLQSPPVGGSTGVGLQPIIWTPGQSLQEVLAGATLSGQSGTSSSAPLTVHVQTVSGFPIPNISMQLVSMQNPSEGPVVACKENQGGKNMVVTDALGNATCTPQFGGAPGVGQYYIMLGGGGATPADPAQPPTLAIVLPTRNLSVTPAAPATIRITQGNNQTVNPSQVLPAPLQVQVDGSSANPLAGQEVRWTASPTASVSIGTPLTTTDANGRTLIYPQILGNSVGTVTITATVVANPSLTSQFTITVVPVVTITGFTLFSGNNQSANVGNGFTQPLIVQVTTSAGSPANIPVQFTTSGPVSISATNVSTDANGRAQVTATAGSVTGAASVTASLATSTGLGSQTFNLTVLPQAPSITAANFVNGADQQAQSLSPCSIGQVVASSGSLGINNATPPFPGSALVNSGANLTINNVGAPIYAVSTLASGRQAITFQVPCETAPGSSVPAVININGATTNVNLNIQAASPGIYQATNSDSVARAVVVRPDGSFVTPSNPARRGENVTIYVTGMGATNPSVGTGSVPPPGTIANALGTTVLGMAGGGVPVVSTRLTDSLPGVFAITFSIPSDMQTGSNVAISVASIPSGSSTPVYSATTKIPVQ